MVKDKEQEQDMSRTDAIKDYYRKGKEVQETYYIALLTKLFTLVPLWVWKEKREKRKEDEDEEDKVEEGEVKEDGSKVVKEERLLDAKFKTAIKGKRRKICYK